MREFTMEEWEEIQDSGDVKAMRQFYRSAAKRANSRLDTLRKSGLDTAARQRAEYYLQEEFGQGKFHEGGTPERMDDEIQQVIKFLNAQTSTVRGEKERQHHIFESLQTSGVIPDELSQRDERKLEKALSRFLASDGFSELKKAYGSGVISAYSEAFMRGKDTEDLILRMQELVNGELDDLDVFDVWEGWSGEND